MKIIPSQWNSSLSAYDYFPYAHKEVAINKDLYVDGRPVHGSWLFLPWHREMLTRMGKELQRAAGQLGFSNEVQFGYWNMSDPEATELFFRNDYMGGYGQYLGENNELNYALKPESIYLADKHPFGPSTGWEIREDLRFIHAEKASGGALVRSKFGNGQMGCLDMETRSKHYKLAGADNPPTIDTYDVVKFAGGTRLEPQPDFYGTPDPANSRCERTDSSCDKYYHNHTTGESIVCRVYGGSLPTWKEMQACLSLPFEDDVNYNFTTLPNFLVPCLEGMNSKDEFSLPGEMAGASWHSPHGKTHAFTGGTSGESPASANDPIFFGIHRIMDYLWYQNQVVNGFQDDWFDKHPELLEVQLPFWGTKVRDTLDPVLYGYSYDTFCPNQQIMV